MPFFFGDAYFAAALAAMGGYPDSPRPENISDATTPGRATDYFARSGSPLLHAWRATGRQARVFSALRYQWIQALLMNAEDATQGDAFCVLTERPESALYLALAGQPLRVGGESDLLIGQIPVDYDPAKHPRDPQLHPALHDLARMIRWDMHEACAAFDDPDCDYDGVDEGIEPVSDEHVALVIWASQRELDRELRRDARNDLVLPAVPLNELPLRVQRAFVERRRLRYQEWGIGRKQWEQNSWSVFDVPSDPDWSPPWPA